MYVAGKPPEAGVQANALDGDRQHLVGQFGDRCPSLVNMAAISSSCILARASSSTRSRISAPWVRSATELTRIGDGSAVPDDPHPDDVVLAAVEDHLVNETAQQRLAFRVGRARVRPDPRQTAREADDFVVQRLVADGDLSDSLG